MHYFLGFVSEPSKQQSNLNSKLIGVIFLKLINNYKTTLYEKKSQGVYFDFDQTLIDKKIDGYHGSKKCLKIL